MEKMLYSPLSFQISHVSTRSGDKEGVYWCALPPLQPTDCGVEHYICTHATELNGSQHFRLRLLMTLLAFCCNLPTRFVFKAVFYIPLYSSKSCVEGKLVEGLQRNKKENTKNSLSHILKIMIHRVALAWAPWSSRYLNSVWIPQLSWSDTSKHQSDAV